MKITKKILIVLILISTLLCGLIYTNPVQAASNNITKLPKAPEADFEIASEGAILMEASTGRVICEENATERRISRRLALVNAVKVKSSLTCLIGGSLFFSHQVYARVCRSDM